jgi:hypothetical protein
MLGTGNVRTARRGRSPASRPIRDRMRMGGFAVASSRGERKEVGCVLCRGGHCGGV